MRQLLVFLMICISTSAFAEKTVKESEIEKSKNIISLFNKTCLSAYLDNDELSNFLLENPFEDLNDSTKKDKEDNIKHYAINHNKNRYLVEISNNSCSIILKNINNDIFNNEFKSFRKSLFDESITENSKSYETRKGQNSYKLTTYDFYSNDEDVNLPFQFLVGQTNSNDAPFQIKLSIYLNKDKEITESYTKKMKNYL